MAEVLYDYHFHALVPASGWRLFACHRDQGGEARRGSEPVVGWYVEKEVCYPSGERDRNVFGLGEFHLTGQERIRPAVVRDGAYVVPLGSEEMEDNTLVGPGEEDPGSWLEERFIEGERIQAMRRDVRTAQEAASA